MKRLACLALCSALAACGGDDPAADAGPIDSGPPGGTFSLTWTLADPSGGPLDCADVAGTTVVVTGVPIDGAVGFNEVFTCSTGSGTSTAVVAGTYNLTIDLRTTGSVSLLAAPVTISSVVITSGGSTAAGDAVFTVDPTGALTFKLGVATGGSNCGAPPNNAGIVDLRMELSDGDGTCLDGVAIEVGAGGGAGGTYTTDCATPPTVACIENDQTLSVAPRRSGPYTLKVTARTDGADGDAAEPIDCYRRTQSFQIPGNQLTLSLGAVTLQLDATAVCDPSL
jgi:hypothetical protein